MMPEDSFLSPALLAGFALAPVPVALLQPLAQSLLAAVRRRHPEILGRLDGYGDSVIGIDPVDLPFVFILRPSPQDPRLTVCRDLEGQGATAVIRGPLQTLIALCEGRLDGDAAFFSRQLTFEGDTEVVLALRNAIDGADFNLTAELALIWGRVPAPLRRAAKLGERLMGRITADMETLRGAMLRPLQGRVEQQGARIAALEEELASLRRRGGQRQAQR